nr:exonuclease domain-containing protein [Salinibacter grassmerensis]
METAGVDPEEHSILEVGAVIDNGDPIEDLPTYQRQIHNDTVIGQRRSLEMASENGLLNSDLPSVKPKHFAASLKGWLVDEGFCDSPFGRDYITVAGKNAATFDIPFLKEQMPHFTDAFCVRARVLDPTTLYYKLQEERPPTLDECLERAGIEEPVDHTALSDALQVVRLIRNAKQQ